MTTTTTTGRRVRADVFTGRGDTATPHTTLTAAPGITPDPATLAAFPVGRAFLTATDDGSYRAALWNLVTAWRAGGFGGVAALSRPGPCPPAAGDASGPTAEHAYAFEDGRVLYYGHPAGHPYGPWFAVDLDGDEVTLLPVERVYGAHYGDTAALDLPQLAVWLIAEFTTRIRHDYAEAWAPLRFAAVVNTGRAEIRLYLYGINDLATASWGTVSRTVREWATEHSWSHGYANGENRFRFDAVPVTANGTDDLHRLGRLPGTVSVVDDPNAFWI